MKIYILFICSLFSHLSFSQKRLKDINPGDGNTFINQTFTTSSRVYLVENAITSANLSKCHVYNIVQDSVYTINLPAYRNDNCIFKLKNEIYILGFTNFLNSVLYKIDSVDYSVDVVHNFGQESFNREISEVFVGNNVAYLFFNSPNQQWVTKGLPNTTLKIGDYANNYVKYKKIAEDKLFFVTNISSDYDLRSYYEDTYWEHQYSFYERFSLNSFNNIENIGNEIVFSGSLTTEWNNLEVWKTSLNTFSRVQELGTGNIGSYPNNFKKFNNKILFNANGNTLYNFDGNTISQLGNVTISGKGSSIGNEFFFSGNENINGFELWKTNVSSSGTQLVQDLNVGIANGIDNITFPISTTAKVGSSVIFRGRNQANGKELFSSNGSSVSLLKEFNLGSIDSYIGEFYELNNKVIFLAASDIDQTKELYVTDGTPVNTIPLASLFTAFPITQLYPLKVGSNYFIFQAFNKNIGYEVFIYKENNNTVKLLKNINKTQRGIDFNTGGQKVSFKLGNNQFFFVNDSEHGNELWATQGDSANTNLVKDFTKQSYKLNGVSLESPGDYRTNTYVNSIFVESSFALLVINGNELWRINDDLSTNLLFKINFLNGLSLESISSIYKYNNQYFFLLNNQLCKYDGFSTYLITNTINIKRILGIVNGALIFYGNDNSVGDEIYKLDLTTMVISLVKDIFPGFLASISDNLYTSIIGNSILFVAKSNSFVVDFWITDGTESGTIKLNDVNPSLQYSLGQGNIYGKIANKVIFSALSSNGQALWSTDGTTSGTTILKDLNINSTNEVFNSNYYKYDSTHIVFHADNNLNGYEPYITDGTVAGTKLMSDYTTGTNSSNFNLNFNSIKNQEFIYLILNETNLVRYNIQTSNVFTFIQTGIPQYFFKYDNQVYVVISENLGYPNRVIKLYKIAGNSLELQNFPVVNTVSTLFIPFIKPFFEFQDKFYFALEPNKNEEIYYFKFCIENLEVTTSNLLLQNSANRQVYSNIFLNPDKVNFSGGKSILLTPGFQTNTSGVFKAEIKGCQ